MKVEIIQILFCFLICVQCQNHFIRILAPQYICDDLSDNATKNVFMSFQPKPPIKLTYKVRIFFKTSDAGLLTQRETLLVWKAVRGLEHKINVLERMNISKENAIEIKPNEMFPGITYIFHVTGITDSGESTNEESFVLKYVNGTVLINQMHQLNLQLIGSNIAIPTMDYIVHASVEFCNAFMPYYVRWTVNYIDENIQEIQDTIGTMLEVPFQNFHKEKEMLIEAEILDAGSSKMLKKVIDIESLMADNSVNVAITKATHSKINIIPSSAKIGVNTALSFQVTQKHDFSDSETLQVSWKVMDGVSSNPLFLNNAQGSRVRIKFPTAGRFHIQANVINAEADLTATSYVIVDEGSPISFDFPHLTKLQLTALDNLDFKVIVNNFHESCEAKWESVRETGFTFFDESNLENGSFASVRSSDISRLYLAEIVDIERDNFKDVEVGFRIPATSKYAWLRSTKTEVSFKFRLNCFCAVENEPTVKINDFFEFILHYYAPPSPGSLKIIPKTGFALTTNFQMSVKGSLAPSTGVPMSYELCAVFTDILLCFEKFSEYKTWETILPYTNTAIEVFANVCSARSVCNKTTAVKLSTTFTDLKKDEVENLKTQITAAFLRTDYTKALNIAIMAAITSKNTNSTTLQSFRPFLTDVVKKEIARLLEKADSKIYFSNKKMLEFVKLSRQLLQVLRISEAELVEQLLEIMDQILLEYGRSNDSNHPDNLSEIEENKMLKHDTDGDIVGRLFAEIYLLLIQDAWSMESKDKAAKWHSIVKRLEALTRNMCFNPWLNDERIENDLVSLYIRYQKMSYFREKPIEMPASLPAINISLKLLLKNNEIMASDNEFCLIVTRFTKDHFQNQRNPVIGFQIYASNFSQIRRFENLKSTDSDNEEVVGIKYSVGLTTQNTCQFWLLDRWTSKYCKSRYVQGELSCLCYYPGYYSFSQGAPKSPQQTTSAVKWPSDTAAPFVDTKSSPLPTVASLPPAITTAPTTTPKPSVAVTKKSSLQDTSHASTTLAYSLPISLVFLLVILAIGFYIFRRYKSKVYITANPVLKPRQPRNEITYAAIQDIHLMRGSY